jgi:ferredoxin
MIKVTFIQGENETTVDVAEEGYSLLEIAQLHDLDLSKAQIILEGACGGALACATCHVILDAEYYNQLPEPSPDELDLLDFAYGATDTSRLGCQVRVTKELDGIRVTIPS